MGFRWLKGRNLFTALIGLSGCVTSQPATASSIGLSELQDFRLKPASMGVDGPLNVSVRKTTPDMQGTNGGNEAVGSAPNIVPSRPYGPPTTEEGDSSVDPDRFRSFGRQVDTIKWEFVAAIAYYTAINAHKLFKDPTAPHTQKEGWFGKSTSTVGVDKLAHAYSAYVVSDLLYARLKRKTGDAPGIPTTAALLSSATMLYSEFWDSIERSGGWAWEDVVFNSLGAGFSVVRNSVPGLDKKLDFRLMIVPHSDIVTFSGKRHFEQQRYFLALKLAGFDRFENTPFRFLELHMGYHGKDFAAKDRARGIEPKRHLFVGVGINLRELFLKSPGSRIGRAAGEVLDYFQPPYTAVHGHLTN